MTTRLLSIVLQREDRNVPWGFRLTGGGDGANPLPVSVVRVCPGTLASRHLVPGDILLAVQNLSTRGLQPSQVDEIIAKAGNTLQLLVQEAGGGGEAPPVPADGSRPGLEATLEIPGPTVYVTCEDATGGQSLAPEIQISTGGCPETYDMSGGIRVYPQMYTAVERRVDDEGLGSQGDPLSPSGSEDGHRSQQHAPRVQVRGAPSPQVVTSPQHAPFAIKVTMTMMPMEYEEVMEEEEEDERAGAGGAAKATPCAAPGKRLPRSIWSYDDMEAAAAQEAMVQGPRQDG